MADSQEHIKTNPAAPAGDKDSLGAESIRDGRPSTCDDVVEAIDEIGPGSTDAVPSRQGDDKQS